MLRHNLRVGRVVLRTSRRTAYAAVGALLSLGAPLGLLALRALPGGDASPAALARVVRADAWTFAYVGGSTLLVFASFGYALGRKADALHVLAAIDSLTGLATRRVFEERLAQEAARARRYGTPLSLLIADVDGLKQINDRDGHRAGDEALRAVAGAVARWLRATDVGARWGGDEFAVLAPSTSAADAVHLAERIRAVAERGEHGAAHITLSVGVACLLGAGEGGVEALLRDADAALYEAKRLGRNRVACAPARA
jgi:diguanylate cyclase (GGDEF)-like protein